jgi:hypothetical protein
VATARNFKDPGDADVQAVTADHCRLIARYWATGTGPFEAGDDPSAEAYKGLEELYTEDRRFKDTYDLVGEGFAEYMRSAMNAYADANL